MLGSQVCATIPGVSGTVDQTPAQYFRGLVALQRTVEFRHSQGGSQPPVTPVPGDLMPSSDFPGH